MDYAKDQSGGKVRSWQLGLEAAKAQPFSCLHCDIPLDVVRMPGLDMVPEPSRRRPGFSSFYFRARKPHRHGDHCVFNKKIVKAVIDERLIRTRAGRPGAPPSEITFTRQLVRAATAAGHYDENDPGERLRRRWRHVRGEDPVPRRGDRATVAGGIERACIAYLDGTARPETPLRVEDADRGAKTYGSVFYGFEHARPGMSRIWHATIRYNAPPEHDGDVLRIQVYGGSVVVERSGWGPDARRGFDAELSILLADVRERWPKAEAKPRPVLFAFEKWPVDSGELIVRDPRRVCVLVHEQPARPRTG